MKVVFLDRDGTLITDPADDRVDNKQKVHLFEDTIEALRLFADNGFNVIIITNQAGIAEGRLTANEFEEINNYVIELCAKSGAQVLKTYMSPHGNNEVNEWRKPGPGMLLQAAKDFNLDLSAIYMIGDRPSDVQAGKNAGTKTILVQTARVPVTVDTGADYTAPSLLDAARYVVAHS
jgi:histidinol-phosphate phosphatase family protein